MKTKTQNLKLIFLLLGVFFSLPSIAGNYGKEFTLSSPPFTIEGKELYANPRGLGIPPEDVMNRANIKNGEKITIDLRNIENLTRVSYLTGGTLTWNESEKKIEVEGAGSVLFYYHTKKNGESEKEWAVMTDVNYYGVLQYQGGDAPNELLVTTANENEVLSVPSEKFAAIWWQSSLVDQDNFVSLQYENIYQNTIANFIEKTKEVFQAEGIPYRDEFILGIQCNDGTSNGNHHNPYPVSYDYITIKDLRQPAPSLEVSPTLLSFHENGGSQSVTVTSNQAWSISSNQAWVSVSPASGTNDGSFTVSVKSNTSQQPRTASITVTSGGLSKTITINQVAALPDPVLELTPNSISAPANGETETGTVTSNQIWNASSNQAWVSVSPASGTNDGSFTVSVESNASQQPRTATITVTVADLSKTISVN